MKVFLAYTILFVANYAFAITSEFSVEADLETAPIVQPVQKDGNVFDSVDDPAVYVNKLLPEDSLIIGTDKSAKGGLHIYNLKGELVGQSLDGRMNNVDIRQDVIFGDETVNVVAASQRAYDKYNYPSGCSVACPYIKTLALYEIIPENLRENHRKKPLIKKSPLPSLNSSTIDPYGLCMYHNKSDNKLFAYIIGKKGLLEQWEIERKNGSLDATVISTRHLLDQSEGCVVDDDRGILYIAQENFGIWKLDANNIKSALQPVARVGDGVLFPDVEGISLYRTNSKTFLFASSQGEDGFSIYDVTTNPTPVSFFRIAKSNVIDKVTHTDGIETTSAYLGELFPNGVLVVQDNVNHNYSGAKVGQNFKIVSMDKILKIIEK